MKQWRLENGETLALRDVTPVDLCVLGLMPLDLLPPVVKDEPPFYREKPKGVPQAHWEKMHREQEERLAKKRAEEEANRAQFFQGLKKLVCRVTMGLLDPDTDEVTPCFYGTGASGFIAQWRDPDSLTELDLLEFYGLTIGSRFLDDGASADELRGFFASTQGWYFLQGCLTFHQSPSERLRVQNPIVAMEIDSWAAEMMRREQAQALKQREAHNGR